MGPAAGNDFLTKIHKYSGDRLDQEHLPIVSISFPELIPDRTYFLKNPTSKNSADGIVAVIEQLASCGARIIAFACNTAHAHPIFNQVKEKTAHLSIDLLNMIDLTTQTLKREYPNVQNIGVLSTTGSFEIDLYKPYLENKNLTYTKPTTQLQKAVHDAIYLIKKNPENAKLAKKKLQAPLEYLISKKQVDALILGCTELPLILKEDGIDSVKLIDPTAILAQAIVKKAVC